MRAPENLERIAFFGAEKILCTTAVMSRAVMVFRAPKSANLRNAFAPYRGKRPEIGKRGLWSQETPFPTTSEKGALSQKIPISIQSSTRKMEIFRLRAPFSEGRTPRGSCNRTLLRRVLRRFFKGSAFLEGFLEGTL